MFFGLLFNLGDLLTLSTGRGNLHTQNDIPDFGLGQTGHIDVVFLAIIGQNKVFQRDLDLDPFIIRQAGPNMMRFRNGRLVRFQNDLGTIVVHVERS